MSLINLGAGLSAAGSAIAGFAHDAGLAEQKSELEKQQLALADQLTTARETTLAHVQGDEARNTATTTASAQGEQTRSTAQFENTLPLTAAQKETADIQRGTLTETTRHNEFEESKPIPAGYNGSFVKDETAPGGWKQVAGTASFTPEMGSLMAALNEKGVSLPAGFRSRQQQAATFQALLDRNPDKTPDEIADGIKSGQIQFGAEKKMTQAAAGIAGKVRVAEKEIAEFAPLIRDASTKVDRGKFVPINQLLQTADKSISDPNLKTLKIQINGMLNAYDVLAGRGGTDAEKRAEAHSLLTTAESPEALEAGLKAFEAEAGAAHRAATAAMALDPPEAASGLGAAGANTKSPKTPSLPLGVPGGSQWSQSRQQWRDPAGKIYDEFGAEVKVQ